MQRFNQWNDKEFSNHAEINNRTAFHEAGHAAAIYLENRRKNLPAIYFQIQSTNNQPSAANHTRICGGKLINDLELLSDGYPDFCRNTETESSLQLAYQADIINLLSGPLAEARYVALRDNESFGPALINPWSLYNYGGIADMQTVSAYLEYFITSPLARKAKLDELFAEAYYFVNNPKNWNSIASLANFILSSKQDIISCEEVMEILDNHDVTTNTVPFSNKKLQAA